MSFVSAEEIATRAMVRLDTGNAQAALKDAEAAVAADPQSDFAYLALAVVLGALNRHEEALTAYSNCAAGLAEYPMWLAGRITCLSKLGRHKEAIAAADEAVRIVPRDTIIWYRRGAALARAAQKSRRNKEMKAAKQALHRAIELDPDSHMPRIDLGWLMLGEGRSGEAERFAREAMTLKPNDPRIHHLLAEVALKMGRWGEAASHVEALASLWPGQPETMRLVMRMSRARSSGLFRLCEIGANLFLRFRILVIAAAMVAGLVAARAGVTKHQAYTVIVALALAVVGWLIYSEMQVKRSLRKPVLSKDF